MSNDVYPLSIRCLHWLMAIIIIGLLALGLYMEDLADDVSYKFTLYDFHKSFGVLIIGLFVIRLLARLKNDVPPVPSVLAVWEQKLAHIGHYLLYFLMIAAPVSGYVMSGAFTKGHGIYFFGITLPGLVPKSETLFNIAAECHGIFTNALMVVILLHIAGALKHRFFDSKEADVLPRMLGGNRK